MILKLFIQKMKMNLLLKLWKYTKFFLKKKIKKTLLTKNHSKLEITINKRWIFKYKIFIQNNNFASIPFNNTNIFIFWSK